MTARFYVNAGDRIESVDAYGTKITLRENDPQWQSNWKKHTEELLQRIRKANRKVLLIVDELPDMLLNMKAECSKGARDFMAWFRKQRETPPPQKDCVRWLVGGSINLAGTLDDLGGIDLINNLSVESLPVFTPDQVRQFVQEMLTQRGVRFHSDIPGHVEQRLGRPVPLFLQMATQELYRRWKNDSRELSIEDAGLVFDTLVTGPGAQDKLQHYHSRIRRYYPEPRAGLAYRMLSLLSRSRASGLTRRALKSALDDEPGAPASQTDRDELFNKIIRDLMNDFYIGEIRPDRFDFESGLMKAWWKKYYA